MIHEPERRGWLLIIAIVIAALALSASALAQHRSASVARAGRLPIDPPGHRPFVPATGDWEGTADGFPASFELAYQPQNVALHGLPAYGFGNLVLFAPDTCPIATSSYIAGIISDHALVPLHKGGSFGLLRDHLPGAVTGPRSAELSAQLNLGGGSPACRQKLIWRMHPARRRAVHDGQWRLRFGNGQAESFTVDGGGRVANGIALPFELASCGGAFGGVNLFVPPSGDAAFADPKTRVRIKLSFAGRRAHGRISAATHTCGIVSLAIAAAL